MRGPLPSLRADSKGATAVEFALVAPVMLLSMLGLFDLGYNIYTAALLEGAIQKAARDSSIEGSSGKTSVLDARVTQMVRNIAPGAALEFKRMSYTSFSDVGKPEDFTDINGNGRCDDGEPYEDANGNNTWDADQGKAGSGGARDAVLYEVKVTYPRPFPVGAVLHMDTNYTLVSQTVLRNQPYDLSEKPVKVLNCP
ncbi:MAG: pilus assembly protein [Novosphingobium sp.]